MLEPPGCLSLLLGAYLLGAYLGAHLLGTHLLDAHLLGGHCLFRSVLVLLDKFDRVDDAADLDEHPGAHSLPVAAGRVPLGPEGLLPGGPLVLLLALEGEGHLGHHPSLLHLFVLLLVDDDVPHPGVLAPPLGDAVDLAEDARARNGRGNAHARPGAPAG